MIYELHLNKAVTNESNAVSLLLHSVKSLWVQPMFRAKRNLTPALMGETTIYGHGKTLI